MYEKILMTSFFIANTIDWASTSILLTREGWQELNLFAGNKIGQGQWHEVIILKMAFTAILIGCFALAKSLNSRWEYPLQKSLVYGNFLVWAVLLWNGLNWFATVW